MMLVGLIDVDSHNYPNLALMKISAYEKSKGNSVEWWNGLKSYDEVLPTADVVEVVRCKDCEHWKCNPNTDRYGVCEKASYDDFEVVMHAGDFCSYGERKE